MKILMVITGMRSGGAERVMATLCNELSKRNTVRLLILKDLNCDYSLSDNVEIVTGNVKHQNFLKSISVIKNQIDNWKPDVVLSFMTKTNIVSIVAKLLSTCKVPIVIAERANPYNAKKIFKIIRRILYPLSNGCVFQTKQAQEYYQNIIKCETKVIRNPLNPDFKVKPFDGIRTKRIVTMGRLSIEKNQIMLIDAFSKIAKCYPEYILEIYGDGPLRSELQQQIKTLNMENKIILKGRKDNIQQYIFDAEIFVLPSNSEGMPNALLESMALGLACISTDCPIGGAAVIIENEKNGLLIPMNDVDALVQSIKILIEDSKFAHKLRLEAVKVLDDFDAVNVCMNWEIYLKNVVENYKIRNK